MKAHRPLVTAHSGCLGTELNSRAHILGALAAGADALELDLRLSRDGRVVLCHDPEVPGPGGASFAIADTTWPVLEAAVAGRGGDLLDLEAGLRIASGAPAGLNLDAKVVEAALAAVPVVRRLGLTARVTFSGLDEAALRRVRKEAPDFRCLLNADALLPASGYGGAEIARACALVTEAGASGINLDHRAATPALMAYARACCIPVHLWTADEEADLRRALDLEPCTITTNRPDRLLALLGAGT